jgi:predicted nucleotidyltransferase
MDQPFPSIKLLPGIFRKYPLIKAVYIFGSTASGKTTRDSDLDLAVVPVSPEIKKQKLDILQDLAREGFDKVDMVFLDVEDIVLRFEAVRKNRIIYQQPGFDRGEYFSLITRQYFDFQPYLKTQREAYKRRVLHGQTGSHSQEIA